MSKKSKILAAVTAGVAVVGVAVKKFGIPGITKKKAQKPTEFSKDSWKKVFTYTKDGFFEKRLPAFASSVAFGGTLSFFPFVVACVALSSMLIDPKKLNIVMEQIAHYLPSDIAGLLSAQLTNAIKDSSGTLIAVVIGMGFAIFAVSGAVNSLIDALNVVYEKKESRNFVQVRILSMVVTFGMVLGIMIILPLMFFGSNLLDAINTPNYLITIFSILRWFLLPIFACIGLSLLYRYGPDRGKIKWQWVSLGAIIATTMWMIATIVFFIYTQYFANFSDSYSLFAGIIVLMMWLNFSSLSILIGAQINNSLEKTTAASTVES